jgi:Flp pilus assembly protein TadD
MLSNLGAALSQSGRTAEAASVLERAVALDPRFRDAYLNLAIIEMGLNRPEAARVHFEQVLRLDPNSEIARQGLAQLQTAGH